VHAWSLALAGLGHPVDDWRIHAGIGMDSAKLLDSLLGENAERLGEKASEGHSERYASLAPSLRPFAHARDLLFAVAEHDVRVVLATSAPEPELKKLRAALDSERALYAVTSADDVESAKPDPDLISVALEKAGVRAENAIMVGDTVWDVEASARAGVRCIAVRSGGIGADELRESGAIAVYDDVAALFGQLSGSPIAELWSK
jgi:HAD superfamily hydrolase (TIGR01509 family)